VLGPIKMLTREKTIRAKRKESSLNKRCDKIANKSRSIRNINAPNRTTIP
jgi:hypothetical protein